MRVSVLLENWTFEGLLRLPCLWYLHQVLDLHIYSTRTEPRSSIIGLWYLVSCRFASISRVVYYIGRPSLQCNRHGLISFPCPHVILAQATKQDL